MMSDKDIHRRLESGNRASEAGAAGDSGATDIEAGSINVSTDWVGYTLAVVLLAKGGERAGRYRVRIEGLPVELEYETNFRSKPSCD